MNYSETKKWLNRYRNIKGKIAHAESMIDDLIRNQAIISKYAFAVQSSNMSDLSNIVIKIADIEDDYKDQIRENISILIETEAAIDLAVEHFPVKDIMRLKYLELMPWSEISKYFKYRYSKDTLMKYHQQGIRAVMKYLNSLA